jgi:hypothetical protein
MIRWNLRVNEKVRFGIVVVKRKMCANALHVRTERG